MSSGKQRVLHANWEGLGHISIGLDKGGYPVNSFLIFPRKHVVGLIRSASARRFRRGASNEYPQHVFVEK